MLITDITLLNTVAVVIGAVFAAAMLCATVVSLLENEQRAARRFFLLCIVLPLPYLFTGLVQFPFQTYVSAGLIVLTLLAGLVLLIPVRAGRTIENDVPTERIDERDVMFSRMVLEEGSERFEYYYRNHPDKKTLDDKFREKAGLLSKNAKHYEPY